MDPKRRVIWESKEKVAKQRKKPEGLAMHGKLETLL
jgi:hypothetical protein